MDTLLRATNLLEVVHRVHQKVSGHGEDSADPESHEGGESPIDYSVMNRKRRLLQISPQPVVKTDYGSDGHSDDRSSSGSPDGNNTGYGSASPNEQKYIPSSPEMRPPEDDIYHHPRLQIPDLSQQPHHAAALQLILQAQQHQHQQQQHQQQQQSVELLQPFLRLSALSKLPGQPLLVLKSQSWPVKT